MQNALYGLKPVCIGLIMTSMLSIGESSYIYGGQVQPVCVLLGICGVFLLLRKKWGIPIVIILAALAGVLVFR